MKWHRARAQRLREHGFTKMAEEHEQIARAMERGQQQEQTNSARLRPRSISAPQRNQNDCRSENANLTEMMAIA